LKAHLLRRNTFFNRLSQKRRMDSNSTYVAPSTKSQTPHSLIVHMPPSRPSFMSWDFSMPSYRSDVSTGKSDGTSITTLTNLISVSACSCWIRT